MLTFIKNMIKMTTYTMKDFEQGRVICPNCGQPIYNVEEAMEHRPTGNLYHEEPCFEEVFGRQLRARGLDTSSMPPELMETVKRLFGI